MPATDKRIDAYIAKSADFAKPILTHLRRVIHAACPDVVETIKWSVPFYEYKGPLCATAAFKAHCRFIFWKRALVFPGSASGVNQFGHITSVADLPKKSELIAMVKKAVAVNESGAKLPRAKKPVEKTRLVIPDFFEAALKKNKKAYANFHGFSPSHQREYIQWIVEAKKEETRARRLAKALEQLAQGKSQNWKYERG